MQVPILCVSPVPNGTAGVHGRNSLRDIIIKLARACVGLALLHHHLSVRSTRGAALARSLARATGAPRTCESPRERTKHRSRGSLLGRRAHIPGNRFRPVLGSCVEGCCLLALLARWPYRDARTAAQPEGLGPRFHIACLVRKVRGGYVAWIDPIKRSPSAHSGLTPASCPQRRLRSE